MNRLMRSIWNFKINSLQQRISFFVLVPLFIAMFAMGVAELVFTRNIILKQWGETAIAKLQRAAHRVDSRLGRPKKMLAMLQDESHTASNPFVHKFIIEQIKGLEGVIRVDVDWPERELKNISHMPSGQAKFRQIRPPRMRRVKTSSPVFDAHLNGETITISADFVDKEESVVGKIDVVIGFRDLVSEVFEASWWKSSRALIIDNHGNILTSTAKEDTSKHGEKKFGQSDVLEINTLKVIQDKPFGTVFGPGHPPDEIAGFCHLKEAAWNIVIIAPGKQLLAPLMKYGRYYAAAGFLFIIIVLLFIRKILFNTGKSIKKVSDAAREIASGSFAPPMPVLSNDEVGQLTQNFNTMSLQLKERLKLKKEMGLAMEVQQNLLPPSDIILNHVEISGKTIYCDETGGDFFDIIKIDSSNEKLCVVVADVVGHGIGAALLMTTARALLRSSLHQCPSLCESISTVNKLLCRDTEASSSFVTLFAMTVDTKNRQVEWVRAGHEPAMIYDPAGNTINSMKGKGPVLGLDEAVEYSSQHISAIQKGSCILIGTDGAWDIENTKGRRFGKDRAQRMLQTHHHLRAKEFIDSLTHDILMFKQDMAQQDDITLMVVKFN